METKRKDWQPVVPYLSLADVFICAISIVFIMLLLVDPKRVVQQQRPQADYFLVCGDDGVRLHRAGDDPSASPLSLGEAEARLAKLERLDALSVRVLIQGDPNSTVCLKQMRAIIRGLNGSLSERLKRGEPGSYLLYDLQFLAPGSTPISGVEQAAET